MVVPGRCTCFASLLAACLPLPAQRPAAPDNLARTAKASASEDYGTALAPAFASDGDPATRWSGVPGHNAGVWFELDWPQPVAFRQVVLQQYDTFVIELDVQAWDAQHKEWRTLRHCGAKGERLPLVVVVDVEPVTTDRLRIGNITNGPSFTEVEVHAEPVPPATVLGSDLMGNVIGVVCDAWGSAPVTGAQVELTGDAAAGPWHVAATSDPHGMFSAPMPLGLRGELAVRTAVAGTAHETRWPAVALQYGLTLHTVRDAVSLDGTWKFLPDPPAGFEFPACDDATWSAIAVPGHWQMQGFRAGEAGGYRRRFDAPPGAGRWILRFDGVYSGARVWVNGVLVAEHDGGAVPFEVDVTELVAEKDNLLAVLATEHTTASDRLDKMSQYADMALGGIFRSVRLVPVPSLHVGTAALSTTWEHALGRALVSGTVSVLDASPVTMNAGELRASLREPGGAEVASAVVPFAIAAWTRRDLPVSLAVPGAKGWNAEQPFLYDLVLELRAGQRALQTVRQHFGLRQTEIRGSELLVNGRPVKLRGTCHHDSDPLLGRAVTAALQRRDVELMREANLDAVRTSHYPPHEALLEAADELGLYVEDEASFCWTDATDDLRLLPRVVQLVAELVARDRNHASVTFWSLCNESRVGFGLWRARDALRRLDPSRPAAGSWARDGSLDFAARHNPITIAGIDDVERQVRVPVLWDESWCIWQDIWGDAGELWRDPGLRDAYVAPLPAIYDRFVHSRVVQGTMIWAWSDDLFLLPGAGLEYGRGDTRERTAHEQYTMAGRGVVGDAQWGVVDGWRRRKPEFWHTKKLHSPLKITDAPLPLTDGTTMQIGVENQYDFLDLSALRFSCRLGADEANAAAAVAPHARGEIMVGLPRRPVAGEILSLDAFDAGGHHVDGWRLRLGDAAPPPVVAAAPVRPLAIRTQGMLNGNTVHVTGTGFEFGFGEELGDLRRGCAFGRELLRTLPRLHVLVTGKPEAPLPAPGTWQCGAFTHQQSGDLFVVTVQGRYDGFAGSYRYAIHPDGLLDATATFVHNGDDVLVREIGLAFAVPRECDLLQWQCRAEWSLYPEDHVGRPVGETRALAAHGGQLPPTWPWARDDTPLGCNDFRSTKRALERGWIGLPDGPGIAITADGHQNLHASIDGDRIAIVVTDFLGGVNGRGEWTENYGTGRLLKKGETLTATVRLQLCEHRVLQPH